MPDEIPGIYRRCGCTEFVYQGGKPVLTPKGKKKRRELGTQCPKLTKDPNHGTWGYQIDADPLPGSGKKRRTIRRTGFSSSTEAAFERAKVLSQGKTVAQRQVPDDQRRAGEVMDTWLDSRRNIKRSTRKGYEIHITKYLKPALENHFFLKVSATDARRLFDNIEEQNQEIRAKRATQKPLKRGQSAPRGYETRRPLNPAGMQRLRATARAIWNSQLAAEIGVRHNPFTALELPSGEPPPPKLWTAEDVSRWRETGEIPGKVMVWTPAQLGAFLDFAYIEEPRLAPLYELIANTCMRRGEACGLRPGDVDAAATRLRLEEQLTLVVWDVEAEDLKSERSKRTVPLSDPMRDLVMLQRSLRATEREQWGDGWIESGRLFTQPGGEALHPDAVSDRFRQLVELGAFPPITLHGLRHSGATTALAAGVEMKVIQELLGHAHLATTERFYASVVDELKVDAVTRLTAAIPRQRRPGLGFDDPADAPTVYHDVDGDGLVEARHGGDMYVPSSLGTVTPTDMARLVAELSTWVREAYQTGLGNEGIHILLGAVLTHKEAQK